MDGVFVNDYLSSVDHLYTFLKFVDYSFCVKVNCCGHGVNKGVGIMRPESSASSRLRLSR